MSSLTPVRDDRSAPRDLSVSGSRARPPGLPWNGGVTRPRSLFSVALLRRGSSLGPAKANQRKDCGAKYPGDSASRYCGEAARPWHFALTPPPPWAAHGNGQPRACLPSELSGYFPEPPNFSAGAFHNQSAHKQTIHEAEACAFRNTPFSPLSTGSLSGACRTGRSKNDARSRSPFFAFSVH